MNTDNIFVCIVIPTHNRATLVMNAIQSVLLDNQLPLRILVSDNSTHTQDVEIVRDYCQKCADQRLTYKRVPQVMELGDHWDWAVQQALLDTHVTHVLFLTDRMIFKLNELQQVLSATNRFPHSVICYGHDHIDDSKKPIHLVQNSWTGRLYSIAADELLHLTSQMNILHILPRMMNCVVPREIFEQIHLRYNRVFDDIAPDFILAYRCLECCDNILYLDRMALVHYALNLSTGGNQAKGALNQASDVYFQKTGRKYFNYAAPVPAFPTLRNSVIHAYLLVRDQTKSAKFPPINQELYYAMIDSELDEIIDEQLRNDMRFLLAAQTRHPKDIKRNNRQKIRKFIFSRKSWCVKFWWVITAPRFQPFGNFIYRFLKIKMPVVREVNNEFDSVEAALSFASQFPLKNTKTPSYLEALMKCKRISSWQAGNRDMRF